MLRKNLLLAAAVAATLVSGTTFAQESFTTKGPVKTSFDTRIGQLDFVNEYPTLETANKLTEARRFQRATQAYLWAMPIVSMADFVHTYKQSLHMEWGDIMRLNTPEGLQYAITGNATTDYLLAWVNFEEEGPWVVDVPEGLTAGFLVDMWQRPVVDLGVPGVNKGKGGKHLVLGPDQAVPEGAEGYNVVRSENNHALMIIRMLDPKAEKRQAMMDAFKIYPHSLRANPPEQVIIDPDGDYWSSRQPRGMSYWERLNWIIGEEPMHERDGFMYAYLRDLGIGRNQEFLPTLKETEMLTEAALVGESMAKDIDWTGKLEAGHYADGTYWSDAIAVGINQRHEDYFELDERVAWFFEALTTSKGMKSRTPGVGSAYLGGYRDSDNNWLDGAQTYKLTVPANPPAKRFWSVSVYHNDTRYLIQNEQQIADKSSRMDLDYNKDGSVDIYFGPKAPKGKEKNWIPTNPGEGWFSYFRLYGPEQEHFDRKWILPNIEKISK